MKKFVMLGIVLYICFFLSRMSEMPSNCSYLVELSDDIRGIHCEVKGSDIAVLLIGGSGDVDLNYTVHEVPLYLELAEGLKEAGISSLRIEKRQDDVFETIEEEWLYRIEEGLDYLNQRYEQVYLLGHSLSAMILPVFENQSDGLIMMAPAFCEIEEVYASQLLKTADEAEKQRIQEELELILSLENDSGFSWFGIPESWWISMDQLNLSECFLSINVPVFILHAKEDDKISSDEWIKAESFVQHHFDAEFECFEDLNHFFVKDDDVHLDESVIEKIVSWILKHSSVIINERGALYEKSNFHC